MKVLPPPEQTPKNQTGEVKEEGLLRKEPCPAPEGLDRRRTAGRTLTLSLPPGYVHSGIISNWERGLWSGIPRMISTSGSFSEIIMSVFIYSKGFVVFK